MPIPYNIDTSEILDMTVMNCHQRTFFLNSSPLLSPFLPPSIEKRKDYLKRESQYKGNLPMYFLMIYYLLSNFPTALWKRMLSLFSIGECLLGDRFSEIHITTPIKWWRQNSKLALFNVRDYIYYSPGALKGILCSWSLGKSRRGAYVGRQWREGLSVGVCRRRSCSTSGENFQGEAHLSYSRRAYTQVTPASS